MEVNMEHLIQMLSSMGGSGVFIGVILESIFAPIPSPLIPLAAGALLITSETSLNEVVFQCFILIGLWGAFGAVLGALITYVIAHYGGRVIIEKYGRYFGFSWEEVEKFQSKLERKKYDEIVLLLCRVIPIIPLSPISILFGIIHFNPAKFTVLTFIGALARYFILGFMGWYFKSVYMQLANLIGFYETIAASFIILLIIVIALFYRRRKRISVKLYKFRQGFLYSLKTAIGG